ncbi:MAG: hypothetical protein ACHP7D_08495 [Lysobacterales bacterium]
MFVAPLPVSERSTQHRRPIARRGVRSTPRARSRLGNTSAAPVVVLAWLALGSAALLFVPAARGTALLGASVPFWLIAAPLIDLAWLERARLWRGLSKVRCAVAAVGAVRAPSRRAVR